MNKKNLHAFTVVELVVVVTILAILGALWFSTFNKNISEARDSQRKANFAKIKSSLKSYKQQMGLYPIPWNNFTISTWATTLAYQWKLNQDVTLSTLDDLPIDPELNIPFLYSVTHNKMEMQIAGTLENGDNPKVLLVWDYKTVSVNVLPTIMVASTSNLDISLDDTKFIFNGWTYNLPYDFDWSLEPISDDSVTLDDLLIEANNNNFWQNSSHRTCVEIKSANKSIWNWEYQVLSNSWTLVNTRCTDM